MKTDVCRVTSSFIIVMLFMVLSTIPTVQSLSKEKYTLINSSAGKLLTVTETGPGDVNWTFNGTMGNTGWYISPITLTCTYNHESIAQVWYQYDNSGWHLYTEPFTIYIQGLIVFEWYTVDYDGNVEPVKSFTFKLDYTPPVIALTVEKIGFMKWRVSANASDAISGLVKVEFYEDDQFLASVTVPPYEWTWTGFGNHTIKAIAYDAAGLNASSSAATSYSFSYSQPSSQQYHQQMNQFLHTLIDGLLRHQMMNNYQ